jgi:serine/threonine protein kinase
MIGEFGETVVLDWGLAKSIHDKPERPDNLAKTLRALKLSPSVEAAQTSHGQILGTPAYMPPEQARGELDVIDERSDVYSLGAVLYELLTGNRPYERGKAAEILQKVITQVPPRVAKVEREAPQELVAVCERAMARDQRDRYRDAKELVADIERFQTGALVSVYRYSLGEYLRRWIRRHKAVAATAAVAAALILLISTIYVVSLQHTNALLAQSREEERNQRIVAEEARNRAEEQNYVSSIRLAFEYVSSRSFAQGSEVLWNAPERYRNWEWGYLLNRTKEHMFSLPECSIARYSPDGLRLTTASREGEINVWDALTGTPIRTMHDPAPGRLTAMQVSPDGSLIATGGLSGTVKLWKADTGEPQASLGPRVGVVTAIEFR